MKSMRRMHTVIRRRGVRLYLKSMVVSQISGLTDYVGSFVAFAFLHLSAAVSTVCGAVLGGIVNCCLNYRYTFRVRHGSKWAIAVKFFLVWLGSLILNTVGTEYFTKWLVGQEMVLTALSRDLCFIVARVSVSLAVSIFWNFLLQRYFVFAEPRNGHRQ